MVVVFFVVVFAAIVVSVLVLVLTVDIVGPRKLNIRFSQNWVSNS